MGHLVSLPLESWCKTRQRGNYKVTESLGFLVTLFVVTLRKHTGDKAIYKVIRLMGGWVEGLACTDPGVRTTIGVSRNFMSRDPPRDAGGSLHWSIVSPIVKQCQDMLSDVIWVHLSSSNVISCHISQTFIATPYGKFPLAPMGVLAPGSAHAWLSAHPRIYTRVNFSAHVSAGGFKKCETFPEQFSHHIIQIQSPGHEGSPKCLFTPITQAQRERKKCRL